MSVIGDARLRLVSSDHIGVPHGGMFGDVARWEPKLNRRGLRLAWSLIWQCFFVYTELPGGKLVSQLRLKHKDGGPITIDKTLVDTLVYLREIHRRSDKPMVAQHLQQRKTERLQQAHAEAAEERSDRAKDATQQAFVALGVKTPKVFSAPAQRRKR